MTGAAARICLRSGLLLILGLSLFELVYGCFAFWTVAHMSPLHSLPDPALAVNDQEGAPGLGNIIKFIGIHLALVLSSIACLRFQTLSYKEIPMAK